MEKYFGEKQQRFSFRKLSVGLVSATISSLFFMSVLANSSVDAQETTGVHYKYVTESELSSDEKMQLVYDIPTYMENDDETYYLVYKLNSQNQLAELPNTGSKNDMQALVAGASLAALGILIFAVSKKKVKNKTVLHLVLVAGIGNGVLISAHALENNLLLNYNTDYELTSGEKLPLPKDISGYTYIGYIKEENITSESKVNNQEKSAATPTKQQKVDYNVTPNFVENPSTVQAMQEEKPVSSTKPTEVQVVEKPLSTELTNPTKEEKQSLDSQVQLSEHKNLEAKKDEKVSPKEKTGVNTLNPQDEVLSGQLNKPELLYREEIIETKIDFQEEIQANPDLAEGTVRVKQEGKLGKKVEVIRIFSVNNEEVSREIVSTSTTAPVTRIVEKGTKKAQVIKEQPETGAEHKEVQSGAIVEPAIQPELPAAVVTDKGEPAVQPELPEAVVTDKGVPEVQPALPEAVVTEKGEPAVQPELPEAVVTDKGETEVQPESPDTVVSDKREPEQVAPLPEYKGPQAGAIVEPEQVAPLPEYTGPQAGAVVEPAIQPELPEAVVTDKGEPEVQPALPEAVVTEKGEPAVQPELPEAVVTDKGETEVQPESPDTVVSDKGEPEQVAPLPEYTGVQAGAIVEPEKVEAPKEYTGVQAGAIVEPEQVAPLPEYTGVQAGAIVEPEKVEAPKEYTGVQAGAIVEPEQVAPLPEYTGPQAGAIVEPEQVAPLPEYTGVQAGAIVEPEQIAPLPEYTGPQAGAIVEPEQVDPLPEYKGNIEQLKPETPVEKPKETDPEKTLELRNVSDIELYSHQTNGTYKQHVSLDSVPSNPDTYFVKVKSSAFKDVYLPVASISEELKDGRTFYKITARVDKLQQEIDHKYVENFSFYLAKKTTEETTNFTSFSNLVHAINQNLGGTYYLSASLNANEVELESDAKSYIKGNFTGKLIGEKDGKHYAIYNLKKPLFNNLSNATVEKLSLKNVSISGKNDIGSLANEATNGTKVNQVHVDGILAGERGIGGLFAKSEQSSITDSSFKGRIINTYETTATYNIGGLVGHLTGENASIAKSKATIAISSNANSSDQTVGGLVGLVDNDAHVRDSYAEGDINNVKQFGEVAGVAGYLWDRTSGKEQHAGSLTNVLSDVNVTNGNAITAYHYNNMKVTATFSNKANRVIKVALENDEVVSKESFEERGKMLDDSKIASKKAEINPLTPPTVEPLSTSGNKESDFSKVANYQDKRALAYKNIEKLLPFYNKATIVKYGNLVKESSNLYQKELLSAVMMKDDQVITDIVSNKQTANKLLLHYKDHSSEKLDLKYQTDFAKLAEYSLGDTGLLYTPNQFLYDQTSIINQVLPKLQQVAYDSEAIRNTLGISPEVKLTELYLEDQFAKTKDHLEESLKKLLSADAALVENNQVMTGYIVDKIKRNKEALLLGMSYLERWYNFSYDKVSAKDLVMYHLDFFGKGNASPLDTLIELGKSGFNNLLAKNNVDTYAISLASHHGTKDLFNTLENYRKVFLPNTSNNEWFKSQTKALIVEEKSNIPEVRANQEKVGSKYSIGVYDRITSDSWKYRNMVLPLLTLPERSVFVISTISSLGFGAYDRYRNKEHQANGDLNNFVEKSAHETAERQRDHYDYWYRILDKEGREKLYRNILLYDAYKFGDDHTNGKAQTVSDFDSPNPAMKHFFGPVGNKVGHNGHGAYATGDAVYYMGYRMLDKDGAITYTHEMTHDSDQDIYLGGYGRRSGLGPEFFAKGLLQAPDHPNDATITINSILKHLKSDSKEGERLQILDPTTRFKNSDDLKQYVHNMFDVVYMLEYLEGQSVVNKLSVYEKMNTLRKIENKFVKDPDGNNVYATNVVRDLTAEEAEKLHSFNDLIENNIISSREYALGEYERNGYFTIKLFAPIYAALSNDDGTPGDLMGRRMAYELLAAKGFKDGMVPYISNQFEPDARANNKTITSYGKTKGLVTDKLVLQKLFNGQYDTWSDFKKAMYKERQEKFSKLNKVTFNDTSKSWTSFATKTTSNIDELQQLMNEAVRKDTETPHWNNYNPETDSAVHKLKRAIFKAYLDQTDDFRSSIFENKK
ncbi:YSIRK-type signal peptide-containing protein [Streptococcus mitis]|uniref:YSIRK-type signal peptide-containing protein n=4 Tax=Streptococcus mitis TaxID=28037 RepID=A0A6L5H4G2_STRMT|nr:ZmpA/ZmpB/ZmpC family metallo-endopeptidase [Streptococcus mitis]MQP60387.1 YSIRK-type signal peptide-containing protein [Streptococcus mitis]MQP70112.1 YSIRK-type signal peptide-containing protein [Streptococcus mitis]MQP71786.1 YSIRK-type signal peptide-containing protein [Streptococcus mitis]MQP86525.1 YSIRK-type signal peptide-containing protein [Streptococcus mitis]MQP89014.1 YSIRK-type signal peptide-containing protein [Streptococcus mitis]